MNFDVHRFGARGDGKTLDTGAINAAITECARNCGGTVFFPEGVYLSGSIHLADYVTLDISENVTILGAPNDIGAYDLPEPNEFRQYQDFGHSHFHNSLIWGEGIRDVRICGKGTIKGGGISRNDSPSGGGDKAIALKECRNVTIEGVVLEQGGHFAILATACSGLQMSAMTIRTTRDGINLDCCSDALIENCDITAVRYDERGVPAGGDDAISLKSSFTLGRIIPSERIKISNCTLWCGGGHAFTIGSETYGDFREIDIEKIRILGADKGGISLCSVDGATLENIRIRDITMEKVAEPLHIILADPIKSTSRPGNLQLPVGTIRNVLVENVQAKDCFGYIKNCEFTSTISGKQGYPLENISIRGVHLTVKGGGTAEQASIQPPERDIDERPAKLGVRPSHGFYCRHIKNLRLADIEIGTEQPDDRPALHCSGIDGLELKNVCAADLPNTPVSMKLFDIKNIELRGPGKDAPIFNETNYTRQHK